MRRAETRLREGQIRRNRQNHRIGSLGDDIRGGDYCGPQSLGEMRGAPGKVGSSRRSRDEAVAARLWAVSQELTGVRYLE